jgi:hypothetical protein
VYRHLLSSKEIRHIFEGKQTNILSSIGHLQKLCNHPCLLYEAPASSTGTSTRGGGGSHQALPSELARLLPPDESRCALQQPLPAHEHSCSALSAGEERRGVCLEGLRVGPPVCACAGAAG